MRLIEPGIVIEDKLLQPRNAAAPKLETPSGIETSTRLAQFSNAEYPIVFNSVGSSILLMRIQP